MLHRNAFGVRDPRLIAVGIVFLSAALAWALPSPACSGDKTPPDSQKSSPKDIRPLHDWGRELFRKGQIKESLKVFQDVIERDPRDDVGHAWTGYLLHRLGKVDEAIVALKRSLSIEERSNTHNNLGNAYLAIGKLDEAIASYQSAIRIASPDESTVSADAYYNLGSALARRGDLEGALKAFIESERLAPMDGLTQNNIGYVLEKKSERDPNSFPLTQALDRYLRAAAMNPENAVFQRNVGLTARKIVGMDEIAKRALTKAVELDPRDFTSQMNLAELHQERDDYPAAIVHYEAAIKVRPDSFVARYNVGLLFVHLIRRVKDAEVQKTLLSKAKTHLHAALAVDPTDRNTWKVLARANYFAGNYKAAGDAIRRYLAFEPNDADAYRLLALIYYKLEDYGMAGTLSRFADQLEKYPTVVMPLPR